MNSQTTLIMFIVMMILTVGGIFVMTEINKNVQQKAAAISAGAKQAGDTTSQSDLTLVNTVGTSIQSNAYKYVQLQVKYTGTERLNLNDTTIIVSTDQSEATLQYRNGTAYRDVNNGFYTQ